MNTKSVTIRIFLIISLCYGDLVEGTLTDIVYTNKGPVQGEIIKTVQTSIPFSTFKAIPYAKPPIGKLRFKPPVEIDAWTKVINATKEAAMCPQQDVDKNKINGHEDCLYLNVYTPKIQFNGSSEKLLAVMVWIYGGAFSSGTIDSNIYGPDFLIENDVVIVAMNYRLGALGFLSLDHPDATGNAGLKDQVLALKWVQKNIKKFGGDPSKVTIFGQSAGSVAVTLHQVSDASTGLFNASIAMSGSALSFWGLSSRSEAVSRAFKLGKKLGVDTSNKDELLEKLYEATVEELIEATDKVKVLDLRFKPTIEDERIATDVFLSECPIRRLKSKNYPQLPVMLGSVMYETLSLIEIALSAVGYIEKLASKPFNNIDSSKIFIDSDVTRQELEITSSYAFINITTDLIFILGIDQYQQHLAKGSAPVYYYQNLFDYDLSFHKVVGTSTLDGCAHGDDILHIFWAKNQQQSLDPTSEIANHRTKMAKMWSNFAKYHNPTPHSDADLLSDVNWLPSGSDGMHLRIGQNKFTMESRPISILVEKLEEVSKLFEETLNKCSLNEL